MCPWTTTDQQLKHILHLSTRRLEQAGRSESLLNGLESSAAGTRCVHDHGDTDQADEAAPAMSKRSGSTGGSTIVSASRPLTGTPPADVLHRLHCVVNRRLGDRRLAEHAAT
jgi:hypothetical protein